MNRSRSTSETSVGLFAFLDVLMSTMGSLILVLMVVTPQIRKEAVARAAASLARPAPVPQEVPEISPQPAREEIIDLNAPLQEQVAELSRRLDSLRETAARKQTAVAAAETDLQRVRSRLVEIQARLLAVRKNENELAEAAHQIAAETERVESGKTQARARLRTIHGQIATASSKYTFVAYDGVSGTTRRPVLIECTGDKIKFLQEDISIYPDDLRGSTPSYNPVAAGAAALIDYWSSRSGPGDPRPYVLIVVRPSGSLTYSIVRRLMERSKDPYGYELLPDDQKVDVPPPDSGAVSACRAAIDRMIQSRSASLFAVGRGTGYGDRGGESRAGKVSQLSPSESADPDVSGLGGGPGSALPEPGAGIGLENPFAETPAASRGAEGDSKKSAGDSSTASNNPSGGHPPSLLPDQSSGEPGSPSASAQMESITAGIPIEKGLDRPAEIGPRLLPSDSDILSDPQEQASAERGARPSPDSGADASLLDGMPSFGAPEGEQVSRGGARKHWGISGPRASIGFERDVTIEIQANRIFVGQEPAIACGRGESSRALAAAVMGALDRDARNWGSPPENFYWVPTIKFVIAPGGNLHYERIRGSLERHGLISSVDFRLESAPHMPLGLPKD